MDSFCSEGSSSKYKLTKKNPLNWNSKYTLDVNFFVWPGLEIFEFINIIWPFIWVLSVSDRGRPLHSTFSNLFVEESHQLRVAYWGKKEILKKVIRN